MEKMKIKILRKITRVRDRERPRAASTTRALTPTLSHAREIEVGQDISGITAAAYPRDVHPSRDELPYTFFQPPERGESMDRVEIERDARALVQPLPLTTAGISLVLPSGVLN